MKSFLKDPKKDLPLWAFIQNKERADNLEPLLRWRVLLWVSCISIFASLIWAHLAYVDQIVEASGQVFLKTKVQVIQNLEGGIVKEWFVKLGDKVEIGDPLLRLEDTRCISQLRSEQIQTDALRFRIARLKAEINKIPIRKEDLTETEQELYQARQEAFYDQKKVLEAKKQSQEKVLLELSVRESELGQRLNLQAQEVGMLESLIKQEALAAIEGLRARASAQKIQAEVENIRAQKPRIKEEISGTLAQMEALRSQFVAKAQEDLRASEHEYNQLQASIGRLKDCVERATVKATVNGVVHVIHKNSKSAVFLPGEPLIELVPIDPDWMIEARVRPQDIGFLQIGQNALVKFSAYDFVKYGGLKGAIAYISPSTLLDPKTSEPYYLIHVKTDEKVFQTQNHKLPILSGMRVQINLITGKHSILEYLLKPIFRAKERAFHER